MRIPRLYTPQHLATGSTIVIDGQTSHHVAHVLRLRTGSRLRIFNGSEEFTAVFASRGRSEITVEIGETITPLPEPGLHIRLAQGIARNDRMDFILQKAVELGISEVQPLWMQRSQSHLRGTRLEKRLQHWQGVIISACEQCGRVKLPSLAPPLPCPEWISSDSHNGLLLMLQPDSPQCLAGLDRPAGAVTLLVGPEGGMNTDERQLATMAGFTGLRLGQRILRTETAALAALSGIQTLWGDFS